VIVSLVNGGGQVVITEDNVGEASANGDYNCTWSPDGQFIAYVRGTFGGGNLVMERADNTSPIPVELEASDAFDGNPDWAPDGRPVCEDSTVSANAGETVKVPVQCHDTGPFYERSKVHEFVAEKPKNGIVGEVEQGDEGPSFFSYTPKAGFAGTDTLQVGSFDDVAGFGERQGTVTVKVKAAPGGPGPVDQPPVVSNVTVKPRQWRLGTALPLASKVKVGTKIGWRLSEAAATTVTFQRASAGRRAGGKCVKQTAANASKPKCKLFRNAGKVEVLGAKAGANKLSFQGRVSAGKTLSPGSYRVSVRARDAAGQTSAAKLGPLFKILPPG
jgi:hypothetical protein